MNIRFFLLILIVFSYMPQVQAQLNVGIVASSISKDEVQEEYTALIEYASGNSITLPSEDQQVAQNALLKSLKDCGAWDKIDILYVFSNDGSENFAKINWKAPGTYTANNVNSASWTTTNGYQGNASNAYIDTGFNPSSGSHNYIQNDASRLLWITISRTAGSTLIDGQIGAGGDYYFGNNSNGHRLNSSGVTGTAANFTGPGLIGAYRESSTHVTLVVNSATTYTTSTSRAIVNANYAILGAGSPNVSNVGVGIYVIGSSLLSQHSDVYDAFNQYINNL